MTVDGRRSAGEYDAMADVYANDADASPYNALYDRPALLDLAGVVRGRRVLDVGCAAGALSEALVGRGAEVVSVDASAGLIAAARGRLGDQAEFHVGDLGQRLDFLGTGTFDLVIASLVLHYLRDWSMPLSEFYRVLRDGERLVFSTHHPAARFMTSPTGNYFGTELLSDEWEKGGRRFRLHYYRRPLNAILEPLRTAGFVVDRVLEPPPVAACRERCPEVWERLTTEPWFLFVSATKSWSQSSGRTG